MIHIIAINQRTNVKSVRYVCGTFNEAVKIAPLILNELGRHYRIDIVNVNNKHKRKVG